MVRRTADTHPAHPGGFPVGLHVRVRGGQFDGMAGIVTDRTPDLRPGSVWVEFSPGHARLVPGYRLAVDEPHDCRMLGLGA